MTASGQPRAEPRAEWAIYRRLMTYARPYSSRLIGGIVCGLIFAGSTTSLLVALKKLFESVFNPLAVQRPLRDTLIVALALPALMAVRGLGFFAGRYLVEWVGNRVVMDLRVAIFDRLQALSCAYFTRSRTGEIIARTSSDTIMVERAVATVLADLFQQPFVLLGAIGVLVWLDAQLAFLTLVLFPLCMVPIAIFGRKVRRHARAGQQRLADLISLLQETIAGVRVVKAFGAEEYEKRRFRDRSRQVFRLIMKVTRAKVSVEPIIVELATIAIALSLLYARWRGMSVEAFLTFTVALIAMYDPMKKLSAIQMTVQQSASSAERIFEIIDADVTVRDAPDARELTEPVGAVRFDRVHFAYDAEPVLTDIDLEIPAGACVALVGSSGSGKTTLANLLPRFYDVTAGAVRINGEDIRRFTQASLRRRMGLVTQETFLFNDTIAANIAYGCPAAPRAAIEDAARRAYALDFIREQPEGFDTVIGERGARLSGGQRQRLAIARALLRDPPILILDEATSALDTESERLVQAALDEVMARRTTLVIAHRLSTVARADRIVVLDHGRIVEQGTHAGLLAQNGVYRRLYDLQFRA